ncbi:restriction endonuclease subunit S [Klebsiella pneumoniae]|uniref:restriction endonuclease subunit S n=1 Tax=Klebsiella pneumoniae complex TaxID=3390273 RepID=UPI00207472B5|nr:restriction endonuclease subunit S [Klebsiella pneumoniae]HBS6310184.1 restriction endonuclease subunit S [Klebsiella pneumoniae]HCI2406140.1 restriction endonuclease subunit S [Klebsiella pneumoniae]HCI5829160.1 restriction endonuclease subunit S [Klebsiella pneumoniae]
MMVPRLRLSLFKDDKSSRWSLAHLGEIVEFKKGKGISKSDISNNGTYPCVRYGELYTIYNEKIDKIQSKTNCNPNEHVVSKSGDILIPASGETAVDIARASAILRSDVILGGDINILSPKSNSLNSLFLSYSIVGKKKMELAKMAQGNSVVHLYPNQLKTLEIWIPLIDEQTKIADFLSTIDEKIKLLTQQHYLLGQYRKGLIQNILSKELRFKDENEKEFPEWNLVRLGNYLIRYNEKSTENNQYPVLTSSREGIYFQKDYFNGEDIASKNNIGYNVVPKGYFTYRHMSDDLVFKFNINTLCDKGIVSTLYPVFTTKLNALFLQLKLNEGNEFRDYAIQQKQGGSRTYMYYSKLESLKLMIPNTAEQTKIANFISAFDDKIAAKKTELDKLKTWKQGLLQQMFV